jgi:putative transposase
MPWKEVGPMELREQFVRAAMREDIAFAWLCDQFGISRRIGYKWLHRFEEGGLSALGDRRREAKSKPHTTSLEVQAALVEAKKKRPYWGPKKLLENLKVERPDLEWPGHSAAYEILKKNGLVEPSKRARRWPNQERAPVATRPNELWFADHKGHFVVRQEKCEPLTITDACSRKLLLACPASSTSIEETKRLMTRVFLEFGLPDGMQTDNGGPFGSTGLGRLSRLSVWLLRLDIAVYRSRPATPTDNGQHERMHATMVKEVLPRIKAGEPAAQAFEEWTHEYNEIRPHEALGQQPPNRVWRPSDREFPSKIEEFSYEDWMLVRRVRTDGSIKLSGQYVFLSEVLRGEVVGLEPLEDGGYLLHVGPLAVATIGSDNQVIVPRDPVRYGARSGPPLPEAL